MEYITPSYEILYMQDGQEILKLIERAARTCYKSERKINDKSSITLVRQLIKSNHFAMIEFGQDIVVKFISNRGFTHEMVRHRLCSFAQESTRYCNYGKGKFGEQITVTDCSGIVVNKLNVFNTLTIGLNEAYEKCEDIYLWMIRHGVPAQMARECLPIGLKAEICVKANPREWMHIFNLRCSKSAHPRMREVMVPLLKEFNNRIPVLYEDLANKYCCLSNG